MDQAWKTQLLNEMKSIKERLNALEGANCSQSVFAMREVNTFNLENVIEA